MRTIHAIAYTSFFWLGVLVYALFSGVQITLPLPSSQQEQAEVDHAKAVLASSVFDVADAKPAKSSKHR